MGRIPTWMLTGSAGGGGGAFDPATLALSNWQRGSFAASPWAGVASAGASNGRNLTEGTNAPAAGAAVNALTPADFDGTNDKLSSGVTPADLFTDTAYTIILLVYVDAFTTTDPGATAAYAAPGFVDSLGNGAPCAGISGTGAAGVWRAGHYDGAWKSAAVAIATGAWSMLAARYNGTNIQVSLNGGAWTSTAAGTVASLTGTMVLGMDQSTTIFLDGKVLEVMTADTALVDGDVADIKSYFDDRYALSL
jgi:hypothetical protein